MQYKIIGDTDCPLVEVTLNRGEVIKLERGSMAYSSNVNIEGKMNSSKKGLGGLLGSIGRSLTSGESMFMTHATGLEANSFIGIAPSTPGVIRCLDVGAGKQYRLNTGAFLACDDTVEYVMKTQDLGKAFFGGTGGLFVMETSGQGQMLISAFGDVIELEVTPSRPLTVDNEHVVAWDSSLDYNIEIASGVFGFTTGEGFVNKFHGSGKVYVQTRNIHNLAETLIPFLPKGN